MQGFGKLVLDPRKPVQGKHLTVVYGIIVSEEPLIGNEKNLRELITGYVDISPKNRYVSPGEGIAEKSPEDILEYGLNPRDWIQVC